MPAAPLRIEIEIFDEGTVATFVDERIVDEVVIETVGRQLFDLVEQQGHANLILNFIKVKFLASAMLAKLFTLRRKIDAVGGDLKLCSIDPDLRVVFKFAPKGSFEIFDDEQKALDAM